MNNEEHSEKRVEVCITEILNTHHDGISDLYESINGLHDRIKTLEQMVGLMATAEVLHSDLPEELKKDVMESVVDSGILNVPKEEPEEEGVKH